MSLIVNDDKTDLESAFGIETVAVWKSWVWQYFGFSGGPQGVVQRRLKQEQVPLAESFEGAPRITRLQLVRRQQQPAG